GSNLRADIDDNILTGQRLEPRELDADCVGAGNQAWSAILPGLICIHSSCKASLRVYDADAGAGQDRPSRVSNPSKTTAEIALRKYGKTGKQHDQRRDEHTLSHSRFSSNV